MIDILQINKFSKLHDGQNIIFCKTDYLMSEFEAIKKINNDVILISGNSDYVIDENIIKFLPKNCKKWYGQNVVVDSEIVKCLPLGLENSFISYRGDFHGVGYDYVKIKENSINNFTDRVPNKFIYSNFNVQTNFNHRFPIKQISNEIVFIDWCEPNLSIEKFFDDILDYEAVICPDGNGPDTHRFYETLYMGRIPIIFNKIMYNNLYNMFPVVFLDDINLLRNYEYMKEKIDIAKNKQWNKKVLTSEYWMDEIKSNLN